jgi:hypothetical protein
VKRWRRASTSLTCGAEIGCRIREHEAYQELSGDGWRKVRCSRHAGEPVPAVIEDDPVPRPTAPVPFTSTQVLAGRCDFKKAQGKDE